MWWRVELTVGDFIARPADIHHQTGWDDSTSVIDIRLRPQAFSIAPSPLSGAPGHVPLREMETVDVKERIKAPWTSDFFGMRIIPAEP